MTDIDLDRETTAAAGILESRLRERDAAVRAGDPELPDAGLLAREYLLILRGRGWRPTEARRMLPPAGRGDRDGGQPEPDKPGGAEYFEFRQHLDQLAAQAAKQRQTGAA
jgi:hypothetical protein